MPVLATFSITRRCSRKSLSIPPVMKRSLGGLCVEETALKKSARHGEQVKHAVETCRRRKTDKRHQNEACLVDV